MKERVCELRRGCLIGFLSACCQSVKVSAALIPTTIWYSRCTRVEAESLSQKPQDSIAVYFPLGPQPADH